MRKGDTPYNNEWQPIETAPTDGTYVLLFFPDYIHKVWIGYYEISEHFSHGKCVSSNKYWSVIGSIFSSAKESHPTHWMPLPNAPV